MPDPADKPSIDRLHQGESVVCTAYRGVPWFGIIYKSRMTDSGQMEYTVRYGNHGNRFDNVWIAAEHVCRPGEAGTRRRTAVVRFEQSVSPPKRPASQSGTLRPASLKRKRAASSSSNSEAASPVYAPRTRPFTIPMAGAEPALSFTGGLAARATQAAKPAQACDTASPSPKAATGQSSTALSTSKYRPSADGDDENWQATGHVQVDVPADAAELVCMLWDECSRGYQAGRASLRFDRPVSAAVAGEFDVIWHAPESIKFARSVLSAESAVKFCIRLPAAIAAAAYDTPNIASSDVQPVSLKSARHAKLPCAVGPLAYGPIAHSHIWHRMVQRFSHVLNVCGSAVGRELPVSPTSIEDFLARMLQYVSQEPTHQVLPADLEARLPGSTYTMFEAEEEEDE